MSSAPLLDHLVYAVPDLNDACDELERDWGIRPSRGGQHAAWGTHNALLDLGDERYLEIIGRALELRPPSDARPFRLDTLETAHLVTWALRVSRIDDHVTRARHRGYDPGSAAPMSRVTPSGGRLTWKLTRVDLSAEYGLVPFLIEWGATPHPSVAAAGGCRLIAFHAEHPIPPRVRTMLAALDANLEVRGSPRSRLVASVLTPRGVKELS